MRKGFIFFSLALLAMGTFSGCKKKKSEDAVNSGGGNNSVYCDPYSNNCYNQNYNNCNPNDPYCRNYNNGYNDFCQPGDLRCQDDWNVCHTNGNCNHHNSYNFPVPVSYDRSLYSCYQSGRFLAYYPQSYNSWDAIGSVFQQLPPVYYRNQYYNAYQMYQYLLAQYQIEFGATQYNPRHFLGWCANSQLYGQIYPYQGYRTSLWAMLDPYFGLYYQYPQSSYYNYNGNFDGYLTDYRQYNDRSNIYGNVSYDPYFGRWGISLGLSLGLGD